MSNGKLVDQTRLAFQYIEKLYFEVSYLIKEVEGLLGESEEKFIFGRPSGYGITARGSTGLDPNLVSLWLLKKLAVIYIPEEITSIKGGNSTTKFENDPRIIYLRIVLDDKLISQPTVSFGIMYDFEKKNATDKWPTKIENLIGHFEYSEKRVFKDPENIEYEDANLKLKGRLQTINLFDITDSEQVMVKIIAPVLEMFRSLD